MTADAAKLLITGASGFVGAALCREASRRGHPIHVSSRFSQRLGSTAGQAFVVGEGIDAADWAPALVGVDVVVHLAGRAHIMREDSADVVGTYRAANVLPSMALARAAIQAGVQRFIFISSVGIYGAESRDHPFGPTDIPAPHNAYSQSKWEAEQALKALTDVSSMDLVVVRPPLVYGPMAKGNFGAMVRWVQAGWPLPLSRITGNRRSFMALDNLVDFILTCVYSPHATVFPLVVSDGEDLSTAELLRRLATSMDRPVRLWPVPPDWLRWGARIVRRPDIYRRLCSSLQVDMAATQSILNWHPVVSVDEGLRRAVQGQGR